MHNYTDVPKLDPLKPAAEIVSDTTSEPVAESTGEDDVVANASIAPVKKVAKPKAVARDVRPALVKDPYGLDDQKKDSQEVMRPLKDEEGRYLCFRHVGNHQLFLYTQHLQTDPNFVPVYLCADDIKAQARG